jgi:hypothetical protein
MVARLDAREHREARRRESPLPTLRNAVGHTRGQRDRTEASGTRALHRCVERLRNRHSPCPWVRPTRPVTAMNITPFRIDTPQELPHA